MDESPTVATMTEHDRHIAEIIAGERSRLRNFIRKRVPNEADAEDLLQDVFYEVVEAYRLMEPVQRWSAWMFKVARNRIIDLLRKKKRGPSAGDPSPRGARLRGRAVAALVHPQRRRHSELQFRLGHGWGEPGV